MKQFPIGGTFSKSRHEETINNINSKLPLIIKLELLNIELSKQIKSKMLELVQAIEDYAIQSHDAENEFNNDCA